MSLKVPATEYLAIPDAAIKDIPVVATRKVGKGSLCSTNLDTSGLWRITRKDCSWYGAQTLNNSGSSGISIYDGSRRLVWRQPSGFSGSFTLDGYCEGGIIVDTGHGATMAINLTLNWRE